MCVFKRFFSIIFVSLCSVQNTLAGVGMNSWDDDRPSSQMDLTFIVSLIPLAIVFFFATLLFDFIHDALGERKTLSLALLFIIPGVLWYIAGDLQSGLLNIVAFAFSLSAAYCFFMR